MFRMFGFNVAVMKDFVKRAEPRPWVRFEEQEGGLDWELLIGPALVVISKIRAIPVRKFHYD